MNPKFVYELKVKYKTLIKLPLPIKNVQTGACLYLRPFTLAEWEDYSFNKENKILMRGLLDRIILHMENIESLDDILDKQPVMMMSILETVNKKSSFDDTSEFIKLYEKHSSLASMNISLICILIMEAFPSYCIAEIMNMDLDALMQAAAMAELKLNRPFFTEYVLLREDYIERYKKEFGDKVKDENYTYDLHRQLKEAELGYANDPIPESNPTGKEQCFLTDDGRILKGDPVDYMKKREAAKARLRERANNIPSKTQAEMYSQYVDIESLTDQAPDGTDQSTANLETNAAQVARRHLRQRLEKEKQDKLLGIKPSPSFDWKVDSAHDVQW